MTAKKTKPLSAGGPVGVPETTFKKPSDYINVTHCLEDFRVHIQAAYGLALVGELRADGDFHGLGTDQDRRGAKPFRY